MGDSDERKDPSKWENFGGWIKKVKNPVQCIILITVYIIGTYKNLIPLSVIPVTFCFFLVFCIMCRNHIDTWIKDWFEMEKYKAEQKTKRYTEKQKSKRAKYDYLKTKEKEAKKSQNDISNQGDDDSPRNVHNIKRKGS